MNLLCLFALVIVLVGAGIFTFSLCVAAKRGDEWMDELMENR